SVNLLKDIQKMSIPLTTLSLFLTDALILQTCLTIPTLISLFTSVPSFLGKRTWADISQYQWSLPALRDLSLVEHKHRSSWYSSDVWPTHPFYIELLKRHLLNLQSLLMHPMTTHVYDPMSPLCWTKMPNLQVLATEFGNRPAAFLSRLHFLPISRSGSVRHLIQFGQFPVGNRAETGLCRYIPMCTRLESVTIVDYDVGKWTSVETSKEMAKFRDICRGRGITVWAQRDVHFPRQLVP
ncbi:4836_t:CDS:1, partial [Acaulospora colombiana]